MMFGSIRQVAFDLGYARTPVPRSPHWSEFRDECVADHPFCAACGNADLSELEAHHKIPFHLARDLELVKKNIVILCIDGPAGLNCHLGIGHLGNFRSFNPNVDRDAARFLKMLETAAFSLEEIRNARVIDPGYGTDIAGFLR